MVYNNYMIKKILNKINNKDYNLERIILSLDNNELNILYNNIKNIDSINYNGNINLKYENIKTLNFKNIYVNIYYSNLQLFPNILKIVNKLNIIA